MEVKLVHPSDPEKKVITATDEQQVAAYRNHGFVEEADMRANETAEAELKAATKASPAKASKQETEGDK